MSAPGSRREGSVSDDNLMLKKQPSINAAWRSYRDLVLQGRGSEAEQADCFLAFWAGAATLFYSIMDCLDEGDEPTAADLKRMDNIHNEIKRFDKTFDAEVLKRHGGQQ